MAAAQLETILDDEGGDAEHHLDSIHENGVFLETARGGDAGDADPWATVHGDDDESNDGFHRDSDHDDDEKGDHILRKYEGEASCYYSQSASLFEDDDSDKDFVSTGGRRTAIFIILFLHLMNFV